MARSRFVTTADIKISALYRFGYTRKLPRKTVEALLVERLRFSPKDASQLAGHWFGSEPYRRANEQTEAA
jgi:hypothetical protein